MVRDVGLLREFWFVGLLRESFGSIGTDIANNALRHKLSV